MKLTIFIMKFDNDDYSTNETSNSKVDKFPNKFWL